MRYATFLLGVCACLAIGCGDSGRLPTYEARGTVVFPDGHPLEGGTIIFESTDHPVSPRSIILKDGSFELHTYEIGDGAPAGSYRVAIRPSSQTQYDRDERRPPPIIPGKYEDFEKSGLEYTVEAKEPNEFNITVERPGSGRNRPGRG